MRQTTLLALNIQTGLGTRYERGPGNKALRIKGGARISVATPDTPTGQCEPLGCDEARRLLEQFREKGTAQ